MATKVEKSKSPLKWILIACGGCLVLFICMLSSLGLLCVTSDTFQESFRESYCEGLEREGIEASEDPFGICD